MFQFDTKLAIGIMDIIKEHNGVFKSDSDNILIIATLIEMKSIGYIKTKFEIEALPNGGVFLGGVFITFIGEEFYEQNKKEQ